MGTRKTSVAIDELLMASAKEVLGTTTVKDTIEQALLEVLRAHARLEEVQALSNMDGSDLADPEIMSGAWDH